MSAVLVDADACPVRQEAIRVAQRYNLKTILVSNGGIRPSRDPMVQVVIVPRGADVADDWIEKNAGTGDIVITQDILLAERCLKKGAFVLGPDGREFSSQNIGVLVSMRELNRHLRETGMGGTRNSPFGPGDRSRFLQALDRLAQKSAIAK